MKRDYIIEYTEYDYYDDIYPSTLKQNPSRFIRLFSDLWIRFKHLWLKVCYIKFHRVACDIKSD